MKTLKTLTLAATTALTLGTAFAATPALASGSVSFTVNPTTADEARALRLGLALFALHQDIRTNGHVTQHGAGHAAGIAQGGPNNRAIIHQEGCNHNGTINQTGGNNAYGLFQFGCNTSSNIHQTGSQSGLTLQFGW